MDRLICAAFPRTASTYFTEALKVAYPEKEIQHIFHKIEILRKESNVITIIRKPEDAIASWLTKIEATDIEDNLDWYNRFMVATLNREDIFVTDFDSVISDVNAVIYQLRDFYSLDKSEFVDSEAIMETLKKDYPDRLSKTKNSKLRDQVLKSPSYEKSLDLYNQVFTRKELIA
jgi:hypothetical protein